MPQEEARSASSEENNIYPSNAIATNSIEANSVEISVSVQSTNENGTMASTENRAAMDKIVDVLIAMGINKSDISPGQFTCQRRSKNAQIWRNESAQIYKYLPPPVSLTHILNSYVEVSPAFFVP